MEKEKAKDCISNPYLNYKTRRDESPTGKPKVYFCCHAEDHKRYFDEISVKEIAEIQGVAEGTVKSRLNYGRKSIKKSVEAYEKQHGIKLHCKGVIPLLLWLFLEYQDVAD